ncbi:MAG TPA: BON domain-containing protein [Pyrinomonadaceae bacterium]|nr:BON domain-containing protein [Pyrinomonadaceae bacterium]
MNCKRFLVLIVAGAVIALSVGCDTATNTNTNTNVAANANLNANVSANANTNANTSRRSINANISREEYERDKDSFAEDARRLGRSIGTGANDGWLWTKTRAVLATTDDLRDSTINIDVDNAVVLLSGTVATQAQKTKAAQVAKGVEGVKRVDNELVVSANP